VTPIEALIERLGVGLDAVEREPARRMRASQRHEALRHYAGRRALDIDGLGDALNSFEALLDILDEPARLLQLAGQSALGVTGTTQQIRVQPVDA